METVLLWGAAGVAIHTVIVGGLMRLVRPVRMELADLCRQFLDSNITEEERHIVERMKRSAFSWWFMVRAVWLLPIAFVQAVARPEELRDAATDTNNNPVARLSGRPDGERLFSLHMQSVMATNPIFTALFMAEAAFFLPAMIIVGLGTLFGSWLQNTMANDHDGNHNGRLAH